MNTRKDFEWAADWLARDLADGNDTDPAVRFAIAFFTAQNPRFDRDRFESRIIALRASYQAAV